ncbi:MAG TPA: signal peptidase II [Longimicrobiales bacterium]|nr:signal peptidase II [Longimicrobiales bacterium]
MKHKLLLAALIVGAIVYADIVTKQWALQSLVPGVIIGSLDGRLPLTLAFNEGVAFGLPLPSTGRYLIIFATLLVLFVLGNMFIQAAHDDWLRLLSIKLVAAGAIGNLIDRVRWDRGVVDFIGPIDLGFMHWPIFNIADMAITTGAILLGISLWREESQRAAATEVLDACAAEETGM